LDKDSDALPLTSFAVEFKPCAIPALTSASPNAIFYPLEEDRKNGCIQDKVSNRTYDDRYSNLGLQISEYDIQSRSGVLQRLQASPLAYNYFLPTIAMVKQQINYSLFARSTITWKLECESKTPREDIMKLFDSNGQDKNLNLNMLYWFAYAILAASLFLLCAGAAAFNNTAAIVCVGILFVVQLSCGTAAWIYNQSS